MRRVRQRLTASQLAERVELADKARRTGMSVDSAGMLMCGYVMYRVVKGCK